ncbi:MerR family transcriptional regulator [Speluncibacter jeojiensis]|uniref:MerR family transcriptional regulator n=1 Tax=Speluncibacter jeojiensis TaxID=2710754 RepID=A0A9X4M392_9ACTN|nr:MerR family transcriptional regulator [Corynebacteriales bacterium D3-21]
MLIGEVAERSGVSVRMLRHYDALGLVCPSERTSRGYREYSETDVRRLFEVESLRTFGLSLTEVKRALDEPGFSPSALIDDLIDDTRRRIESDNELLARLLRLRSADSPDWHGALRVVTLLRAVESGSVDHRFRAVLKQGEQAVLPADALAESLLAEEDLNVAGALRWALARAEGDGLPVLAAGLGSSDVAVRRRAVAGIAALDDDGSTELLLRALGDPDLEGRDRAALTLGSRGRGEAMRILAEMVAEGRRDVEAAETLGGLAGTAVQADEIVEALRECAHEMGGTQPRLRTAQALYEIPGAAADHALEELSGDDDPAVAATAKSILSARA